MTETDTTKTLLARMDDLEAERFNHIKALLKQKEEAEKSHELLLKSIATGLKALRYHKVRGPRKAKPASADKAAGK